MIALAVILCLAGIIATGWGVWAAFEKGRSAVTGAVVAPIGVGLALVGALLLFVPHFFG